VNAVAVIDAVRIAGAPALTADVAGSGPLLIFIHGVGGGRRNWQRQVAQFGQHFRAVAVDLRGYGDSDDDGSDTRRFEDFADDIVRIIDHFGESKAHICGLSMGGRVALDLIARHPARVASLTLADTSAGSAETQDPAKIEAFLASRRAPLLAGQTPAELAPVLVETLAGPNATADQRAELIASLAALRTVSYLKTLEAVTRFTAFPDFAEIAVPVQVIVGSEDRVAPPHVARAMAEAIPGARFAEIAGAGHISNVESPDVFNAILADFSRTVA